VEFYLIFCVGRTSCLEQSLDGQSLLVVGGDVERRVSLLVLGVSVQVLLQQQQLQHLHVSLFTRGMQWCSSSLKVIFCCNSKKKYLFAFFQLFCHLKILSNFNLKNSP